MVSVPGFRRLQPLLEILIPAGIACRDRAFPRLRGTPSFRHGQFFNKRFLTATATLSVSSGCSRSALLNGPTPKPSFNVCSTSPPPIQASNGLIVTEPNPASTSIERTRFGSANANGPGAVGSGGATVNSRELPVDLHDALCLLTARRASEYPSFVSEVPEIVIRIRASCQYR